VASKTSLMENSDKEIEIIHELAQKVLEYEALLTATSDICGELDRCICVRYDPRSGNLVDFELVSSLWCKALECIS